MTTVAHPISGFVQNLTPIRQVHRRSQINRFAPTFYLPHGLVRHHTKTGKEGCKVYTRRTDFFERADISSLRRAQAEVCTCGKVANRCLGVPDGPLSRQDFRGET